MHAPLDKPDRFIDEVATVEDDDLLLAPDIGVARQRDFTHRVAYDDAYFDKYIRYEDEPIALAINAGRIALVDKYLGPDKAVLDIGVGSGEFIKKRPNTWGHDVNPKAMAWLQERKRWSFGFGAFEAFTFWDVIEHVPTPDDYFRRIHDGAFLFTSLPIFADVRDIRASKHYRPGEHLYYFTEIGFIWWMAQHGFDLLYVDDFETRAGREDILSFAFRKGR